MVTWATLVQRGPITPNAVWALDCLKREPPNYLLQGLTRVVFQLSYRMSRVEALNAGAPKRLSIGVLAA